MEPQQPLVLNCVHWHSTYWQVGWMPSNVDEHWETLEQHKVLILIVTKRMCTCASNMWLLLQSYNSSFKLNFQLNSPLNFLKSFLFVCILPHNQWLMYNLKIFALSLWKWFLTHLWPSLEAGHNRELCTLRAIRDRLSFSFLPPCPPTEILHLQQNYWTRCCVAMSPKSTRALPPGRRRATPLLHWQETCTICSVAREALSQIQTEESCDRHHFQHARCTCARDRDDFEGAEEHHFTHTGFHCFFKTMCP